MVSKDVEGFICERFEAQLNSITNLSKSQKGVALVHNEANLYNFDDITKSVFRNRNVPASADAIHFTAGKIILTEFKSGFKKKITKQNMDKSKMCCHITHEYCAEYANLFFSKQRMETEQLVEAIRLKAIESYITLEKMILPRCNEMADSAELCYYVVIDDAVESIEGILSELAGADDTDNSIVTIKRSLRRFCSPMDADGNRYYYDIIEVMSPFDYIHTAIDNTDENLLVPTYPAC